MEIAKDFADWYRVAGMEPNHTSLLLRWKGIEAYCKTATRDRLLATLRAYCLSDLTEETLPVGFREAFKTVDTAFSMRNNFLELRVLAGAALRYLISADREPMSTAAAIGIVTGSFGPRGAGLVVPEHVPVARRFLAHRGAEVRKLRPPHDLRLSPLPKVVFPDKSAFAGALDQFEPHITEALTSLANWLDSFAKLTRKAVADVHRLATVQGEQADVLWWMQGGCDRGDGRVFDKMAAPAVALMAAVDLAELSRFVPGPPSAKAVLIRVLMTNGASPGSSVSIADAASSVDLAWREQLRSRFDAHEANHLCPLLSALSSSGKHPTHDWADQYDASSKGIPASLQIVVSELAEQLYSECLLVRILQDCP